MTDYDSMSVHELVGLLVDIDSQAMRRVGIEEVSSIESALRRAVIRESSVGEISIEQHEGYMSPDPLFTVGTKSKLRAGEFYIVPKEKE